MRIRTTLTLVILISTLVIGSAAFAQEGAEPLKGTVYLRGGQVLSGVIRIAELGVVPGSGIGTLLGEGGEFTVRVDDKTETVKAAGLAALEADWANEGTEQDPRWKIQQITLTTKAGATIVGKPTWLIHASEVSIEGQPAVHAFPLAGTDFSPDNFITKIVLGEPLPAETPPAELPPPPAETPPVVTPAVEAPPAEAPPAETPPGEVVVSLPPPLVTEAPATVIGEGEMSFTITCPECGKKIRITIKAEAVEAE